MKIVNVMNGGEAEASDELAERLIESGEWKVAPAAEPAPRRKRASAKEE